MATVICALGFGWKQEWGWSLILEPQFATCLPTAHSIWHTSPIRFTTWNLCLPTHKYSRHTLYRVKVLSLVPFKFHSTSILFSRNVGISKKSLVGTMSLRFQNTKVDSSRIVRLFSTLKISRIPYRTLSYFADKNMKKMINKMCTQTSNWNGRNPIPFCLLVYE